MAHPKNMMGDQCGMRVCTRLHECDDPDCHQITKQYHPLRQIDTDRMRSEHPDMPIEDWRLCWGSIYCARYGKGCPFVHGYLREDSAPPQ
jgi:hypothetical protein